MTTPHYADDAVTLYHGDCLEVLRALPDASVDAVVTDPPYGLEFMGKEWDAPWRDSAAKFREPTEADEGFRVTRGSLPDAYRAGAPFQSWCEQWATECLRVLKPGGHLLAFGGTRTWHRLACAIEDAGFEVRDSIAWLYGCLTADTEVLTEHGWKHGIDVTVGDRVAQWDHTTGTVTLAAVERTYRAPWDGPMRVLRHADTDQVLTPNHRVYHESFDRRQTDGVRSGEWSGWKVAEAADLPHRFRLPLSGRHDGPGIGGPDYAALLGWVWTEGGFDHSGTGVRLYQSSVNQDKCDEIAALLDRIAPDHKRYDRDRTYNRRNGEAHRYTESTWFLSGPLAERVRVDLPGKRPTYDLLWRMTAAETEAMIRAAMLGDGSGWGTRSQQFYQQYEDDLTWFQTALHLTDRSGKVGMRPDRPGGAVYLRDRATTEFQPKHLRDSWEDYTGEVWCVRVPTGAFMARRNGHVFITGNSGFPKSLDVSKSIDKAAGAEREVPRSWGENGESHDPKGTLTGRAKATTWCESCGRSRGSQPSNCQCDTRGTPATDDARRWQGWGTALKPAFEPVVVARKPLAGTVAANVLAHGTGALNIDATRVGTNAGWSYPNGAGGNGFHGGVGRSPDGTRTAPVVAAAGRWPANVVLTHLPGCREVGTTGERVGGGAAGSSGFVDGYERGDGFDGREVAATVWACEPGCQVRELDRQSGVTSSREWPERERDSNNADVFPNGTIHAAYKGGGFTDTGGASRFFLTTKGDDQWNPERANTAEPTSSPRSASGDSAPGDVATSESLDTARQTASPSTSGTPSGSKPSAGEGTPTPRGGSEPSPGQPLAGPTPSLSRAPGAERSEPTGTTTTTTSPSSSSGSVGPATSSDTSNSKERGEPLDEVTSRFIYCAKAPTTERPREDGIAHPTVKPLDLMRYLVRLVTPPGGVVLDPFVGSGTTAEACVVEGFRCIAVEREADYLPLIVQRLTKPIQPDLFGGTA